MLVVGGVKQQPAHHQWIPRCLLGQTTMEVVGRPLATGFTGFAKEPSPATFIIAYPQRGFAANNCPFSLMNARVLCRAPEAFRCPNS